MRNGPYELVVAPADYPGMKYRGRYVYEHQLVWWQKTGKLVPEGYVIHHINGEKRDNCFSNLKLESRSQHGEHHGYERGAPPIQATCGWCQRSFDLAPREYNRRFKQTKSGQIFCCKSHQVQRQQADRRSV